MKQFLKYFGVAVLGIVIGLVISSASNSGTSFGGVYNQVNQYFAQGISIGKTPVGDSPVINKLVIGSGNFIGSDASMTGTSTKAFDIAVTGAAPTDNVIAELRAATYAAGQCWNIAAAKASTTPGYITIVLNNCGITAIPSVNSVGSTTAYILTN